MALSPKVVAVPAESLDMLAMGVSAVREWVEVVLRVCAVSGSRHLKDELRLKPDAGVPKLSEHRLGGKIITRIPAHEGILMRRPSHLV